MPDGSPRRIKLPTSEATDSLGGTLRLLSEAWNDAFHAEIDRQGVTRGQWRFLRELWHEDGLTQAELAARVGRREPTAGTAVRALLRRGLIRIERSQHDRRKTRIFLSGKGRALESQLVPLVRRFDALATEGLSPREVEQFRALMRRLRANVDALSWLRWSEPERP
jgi:DNA-binding MarR family transcriptional regulator